MDSTPEPAPLHRQARPGFGAVTGLASASTFGSGALLRGAGGGYPHPARHCALTWGVGLVPGATSA